MLPLNPHDPPTVGVYRLHTRLGEDACARVYLATAQGRPPVALKIVRSTFTGDPGFRSAFTRQVEGATGLRSPFVAPILDHDVSVATPWVAVARPFGPSLAELVGAHGPFPVAALHPLALALAQGLADLHAADRAHGSMWPDGVLLSRRHALLADPGLEWAVADAEQRAPHPSFAAPEGGATPATDVFAWAATVCFAASGVEGPEGLDRVPLQFRGLVDACLKVRPVLRPSAADLVRMLGGPADPAPWPTDLQAVVERSAAVMDQATGRGTAAPVAQASEHPAEAVAGPAHPAPSRRRGRAYALAAGGIALVLVAGAGAAWGLGLVPGGGGGSSDGAGASAANGCLDATGYPAPSGEVGDLEAMRVAFSPDGDALAVTSAEYGLMLWNWRAEEEVARVADEVHGLGDPRFAPQGCVIAAISGAEYEGEEFPIATATTFDVTTGETVDRLATQEELVETGLADPEALDAMAFSPTGELAVATHTEPLNQTADGQPWENLGLVDLETGEVTSSFAIGGTTDMHFLDAERVVTLAYDTIRVWSTETGEELHTVRNVDQFRFAVVPGTDQIVYAAGGELVWWDVVARTELGTFDISEFTETEDAFLTDLTVDADLGLLHVGWATPSDPDRRPDPNDKITDAVNDNRGHLWDLETGEELLSGPDHVLPRPLAFHPGGEVIAAIDSDGGVDLVDPETLEVVGTLT
ncbi:WD40 repeat protein [Nocardiopsis sp. Huas11]|uniref:protein kinase family protein n=1 Tax=Nocardiopsis sp. Huas11 TaxID=2183912 RepID=UPI000EB55382|nr:protein kinase family protein [Nocardiopsis sp. Huas11]RKS06275.1 WD40 repeat protein [Nocardiopsis sp. Huas11]